MKRIIAAVLMASVLVGCNGVKRLTDTEPKDSPHKSAFYAVSCCQDYDGAGRPSYPSFLPASHIDLCQRVKTANHNDEPINGDIWLALEVDCGHGKGYVGDEYYNGRSY